MCGLFGFSDYGHKINTVQINELINALAEESAIRGTDATGIAYNLDGKLEIEKEPKSAYVMTFKVPKGTSAVIGHTRHSTQGSCRKRYNNHPFRGRLQSGGMFALAHNGIIANDVDLRKKLQLPETKIETDSYISVQLLEREKELSFKALSDMAEELRGSFSFALLDDQNSTYLLKGDNPISILHFTDLKLYAFASTDQILWRALSNSLLSDLKGRQFEEVSIKQGEILKILPDGALSRGEFENLPSMSGLYAWWEHDWSRPHQPDMDEATGYINELKSVAGSLGYAPDDIDYMLRCGYTLDEIEETLYGYGDDFAYALANK